MKRLAMIDKIEGCKYANPITVSIPKTVWIVLLTLLLWLPLETDAQDEIKEPQKSKNYAVAPSWYLNRASAPVPGPRGCFFYDVGSDREGQPRSSVQLVGAYTHTDSYFSGGAVRSFPTIHGTTFTIPAR